MQFSPVHAIADDIFQLHIPLPFLLNRVNVYLIRGDHGWTVVDTGLHHPDALAAWDAAFSELGFLPNDIEQIVLTHTHPDHFGLAGWLQNRADQPPPVYLSPIELALSDVQWRSESNDPLIFESMERGGAPSSLARAIVEGIQGTRAMTTPQPSGQLPLPPDSTIQMGRRVFRTIHAPGHSDGQLMFYDEGDGLLLSGDHVLNKITPNIGLWSAGDRHPLRHFLDSLREVRALDVRVALPGHKTLITDWRGRIDELLHHHTERLERVRSAVDGGATTYQVATAMFDFSRLTTHEMRFAMVEAAAHLEYLVEEGLLIRDKQPAAHYRRP